VGLRGKLPQVGFVLQNTCESFARRFVPALRIGALPALKFRSALIRVAELGYPQVAFDILDRLSTMPTAHTVSLDSTGKVNRDHAAEIRSQGKVMTWVPETLKGMAPHLDEEWLGRAYELTKRVEHAGTRAAMLAALGPYLGAGLMPEVLAEVEEIWDGNRERCNALVGLVTHLDEKLLRVAIEIASRIDDSVSRAEASAALVARLAAL
jgi:hypothetical protein